MIESSASEIYATYLLTAGLFIGFFLGRMANAQMWKIVLIVILALIVGLILLGFSHYEKTLESDLAFEVIMNTDCEKIKQFLNAKNVLIPFHTEKLSKHYIINC